MPDIKDLRRYYQFDEDILDNVSAAAASQDNLDYLSLAESFGSVNGATYSELYADHIKRHDRDHRRIVLRWLRSPHHAEESAPTRVLFAPFALSADQNIAMRAMRTMATIDDGAPMMVVGAPNMLNRMSDRLNRRERRIVSHGEFRPLTVPVLNYLSAQALRHVEFMGYSYGAEVAAQAAADAHEFDINVDKAVLIEPVAVANRSVISLLQDFLKSGERLEEYVQAADSPVLNEARQLADEGKLRYIGALLRPTNIAIARGLSKAGFMTRVSRALQSQQDMRVVVGWGKLSELSRPENQRAQTNLLRAMHKPKRVVSMPLEGMHHAGGDDINLHAAIMAQGLRLASPSD